MVDYSEIGRLIALAYDAKCEIVFVAQGVTVHWDPGRALPGSVDSESTAGSEPLLIRGSPPCDFSCAAAVDSC